MNPSVLTQFALPDPNASPLTVTQLVQLLNVLVSSEIQGSYTPYVIQAGTPGVDDRDKSWLELDSQGRPIAIKIFWHGHWRRVYNGMMGEIRAYSGDPSIDFDTFGLGKVGQTYDGWHLCNGKQGIIDLSDRFIIGAHMNGAGGVNGYKDGEWVTTEVKTDGEHQGGVREITLTDKNTYVNMPKITVGRLKIDAGGEDYDTGGLLYGRPSANPDVNTTIQDEIKNTDPEAINVIPVYLAFAYIIFVGYST